MEISRVGVADGVAIVMGALTSQDKAGAKIVLWEWESWAGNGSLRAGRSPIFKRIMLRGGNVKPALSKNGSLKECPAKTAWTAIL